MKSTLNTLKVLAEESRLRIFLVIQNHELCVCQIMALLGLAASTTSKHLALMYQAGIVDQRKDGRWAYYSVSRQWCRQNASLTKWLASKLKVSAKAKTDAARLSEILAMPLDQLCQPSEKCCFPEKRQAKGRKK